MRWGNTPYGEAKNAGKKDIVEYFESLDVELEY